MKQLFSQIDMRRAFFHFFICSLYLSILFVLNWISDGMTLMRAIALLLTASAGIGIAYLVRHAISVAIGSLRVGRAIVWVLGSFLVIGITGYLVFHGFENPLARDVVDPTVTDPAIEYILFYVGWYFKYAQYGLIFYGLEFRRFQAKYRLQDIKQCAKERMDYDEGEQASQYNLSAEQLEVLKQQMEVLRQLDDKIERTLTSLEREWGDTFKEPLLQKEQVMELLRISDATYRRYVDKGDLNPMCFDKIEWYFKWDLHKALEKSRKKGKT